MTMLLRAKMQWRPQVTGGQITLDCRIFHTYPTKSFSLYHLLIGTVTYRRTPIKLWLSQVQLVYNLHRLIKYDGMRFRLTCRVIPTLAVRVGATRAGRRDMTTTLIPYNPPEWAGQMKHIPKYRVQLVHPNTPIHEWRLPGLPESVKLSIKRDDMTGSTLSGNKVRKLEFLMAEALAEGCTHVVTCGGLQSNHCRAVAVCARQLGLQPHLVLRSNCQAVEDVGCSGNVLLDRMCGAQLYLVPLRSPYLTHLKPRMEQIAEHIRETTGEKCYHIPVGGSNSVGLFGYINVFQELITQGVLEQYDDVVFACGSGGTAGGLAIANYLTGSKLRIHGVSVSDDAQYFLGHVTEMMQVVGIKDTTAADIVDIIDGYKGKGYGVSIQKELDFLTEVSRSTGIILDPVYTGKGVLGMVAELKSNPGRFKGNRILYLHTGGVYGLYDGRVNSTLLEDSSSCITMWPDHSLNPFTSKSTNST